MIYFCYLNKSYLYPLNLLLTFSLVIIMSSLSLPESNRNTLPELIVNPLQPITHITYNNVLPGGLQVLKFQDNLLTGGKHIANITDLGRTLNAITYLASKWLCSRSKYVRSTILDSRGNWQIKRAFNPEQPVYRVKINQVMRNNEKGFTSIISPDDTNIPKHVKVNFLHLLNTFMQFYKVPDCMMTQLVLNFQFIKYDDSRYYFLIDDVLLLDECLFNWNGKSYPYSLNSYLIKLSKMHPHEITELDISECYNNIFKVLELTPGFSNGASVSTRILFNCRTLEEYISIANQDAGYKYY